MDGGLTELASGNCSTTLVYTPEPTARPTSAPTDMPTSAPTDMPTSGSALESYLVEVDGGYYPWEVSWYLTGPDADSNEVSFYGMESESGDGYYYNYYSDVRHITVHLQPDQQYTVNMKDSFGDGWNGASWNLLNANSQLVAGPFYGPSWGYSDDETFITVDPTISPSGAPTDSPTYTPTNP